MSKAFFFRFIILILTQVILQDEVSAQKNIRGFVFENDQMNPNFSTTRQDTSISYWMEELVQTSNHTYGLNGRQRVFSKNKSPEPADQLRFYLEERFKDSTKNVFATKNFNTIIIAPDDPDELILSNENYQRKMDSALSRAQKILDWCIEQNADMNFYLYQPLPKLTSLYGEAYKLTEEDWDDYYDYLNGIYNDWFTEYHDQLTADYPFNCIKMIPVGAIVMEVFNNQIFEKIPIHSIYRNENNHGHATISFLAALTFYMIIYEEKASTDFMYEHTVADVVHPNITFKHKQVVELIWQELQKHQYSNGDSRVFCELPTLAELIIYDVKVALGGSSGRRHFGKVRLTALGGPHEIEIYDPSGNMVIAPIEINKSPREVIIANPVHHKKYLVIGRNQDGIILYQKEILLF